PWCGCWRVAKEANRQEVAGLSRSSLTEAAFLPLARQNATPFLWNVGCWVTEVGRRQMNRKSTVTSALGSLWAIGSEREGHVFPRFGGSLLFRLLCSGCALVWLLSVVAVPQAWSQQQASLSGIVSDPSGAVIPGATIRATNVNTQVTVSTLTNST